MWMASSVGITERFEWWIACHCALFLAFYWFLSPLQHIQDKSHNSQYFWGLHILTYLLLVNVLRHTPSAPRGFTVPFQFTDVATFFLPALVLSIPGFCLVEGLFRTRGLSGIRTFKELVNNALLTASAVSLQYGFCTRQRGDLPPSLAAYCECLEHPVALQFPVVLTIGCLYMCSLTLQMVLGRRHGFFSCGPPINTNVSEAERLRGPHPAQRKSMVPWYSLSMTTHLFDLVLMVKVFLGKFDARVLLSAQSKVPSTPFEDLSKRDELWFDFLADGGDGFDSTYTISRLLAQPHLSVDLPRDSDIYPTLRKVLNCDDGALRSRFSSGGDDLATFSMKGARSLPSFQPFKDDSPVSASVRNTSRRLSHMLRPAHCNKLMLPRGNVVFHGGDVAYPFPCHEEFVNRFIRPLEWALPRAGPEDQDSLDQPQMFLIPGNHDWYDGLETFLHWVVNRQSVAGWRLPQKHTYYAVKLPHGWWVWGLDLGLSYDLDRPQYDYFCGLLESGQVEAEDRVVVLTHRPNWVFDVAMCERTGYILNDLLDKIGEPRLAMRIAGDLHHYTRYMPGDGLQGPPLVTSGGAGAFLHPTHYPERNFLREENVTSRLGEQNCNGNAYAAGGASLQLPESISKASGTGYERLAAYPDENVSRRLTWLNPTHFRNRNWGADVVLVLSYILMVVSVIPLCRATRVLSQPDAWLAFGEFVSMLMDALYQIYSNSYISLFTHFCFLGSMVALAESHMGIPWKLGVGFVHYACHAIAAVVCICLAECAIVYLAQLDTVTSSEPPEVVRFLDSLLLDITGYRVPLFLLPSSINAFALSMSDLPQIIADNRGAACAAIAFGKGMTRFEYMALIGPLVPALWIIIAPIASFIFGCYLLVSLNWLGQHWTEAFSSLKIKDYKHFIRMNISPITGDLNCFVIGVDHVPTHWEMDPYWDELLVGSKSSRVPPWKWVTPSKYRPRVRARPGSSDDSDKGEDGQLRKQSGSQPKVVDFFVVKASRKRLAENITQSTPSENSYTEEESDGGSVDVRHGRSIKGLVGKVSSWVSFVGSRDSLRDEFNMLSATMELFSSSSPVVSLTQRVEWWVLLHFVMFLAFYWFLSPLQHIQDADRNSQYFWFVNLSTYFLLITVFRHTESAPAGAAVPFRFSKVISFFLPALVLGQPGFYIVEGLLRMRGNSMERTRREHFNNLLLMASALSLQYGFCKQEEDRLGSYTDQYCEYLDSPVQLQFPVVLTMLFLYGFSWLTQRILGRRHGFFSAGPVLAKHPQAEEEAEKRRGPDPKLRKTMVSWYSLFMTTYIPEVTVMLKVFMGRFDVRALMAALTRTPEKALTFDDQSDKEETWFDFFADGGDGFDSSYTVGRLIAQPYLGVDVPEDDPVAEKVSKLVTKNLSRGTRAVYDKEDSGDPFAMKRHKSMPTLSRAGNRIRSDSASSDIRLTTLRRTPSDTTPGHRRIMLPRASVVFHGGDLAYPVPSHKAYVNRLVRPLEWAFPPYEESRMPEAKASTLADQPQFFAIPGNHDWYDGLETYLAWFVGQDHLAGWKLPQKSSYFAVKLSHGWWVWGLDLSLSYDLDKPQYDYFCGLLDSGEVGTEDRVVVITHRPNWESDVVEDTRTGYILSVLLDKIGEPRLAMRLAGDVHHYSRYMPPDGSKGVPLVTSGGAGAFLHPTHFPAKDILREESVEKRIGKENHNEFAYAAGGSALKIPPAVSKPLGTGYTRVKSYPPEKVSRRLNWLNPIHFRRRNWGADVVLGMFYLGMSVSALPLCGAQRVIEQPNVLLGVYEFIVLIFEAYDKIFRQSYVSLVGQIMFIAMAISGAEAQMGQAKRIVVGLIHGLCHSVAAIAAVCLVECLCEYLASTSTVPSGGDRVELLDSTEALIASTFGSFWASMLPDPSFINSWFLSITDLPTRAYRNRAAVCACMANNMPIDRYQYLGYLGSILPFLYIIVTPIASFIFGVYLLISLNYLGQHWNEAFSSLRIQDYKHFLRMWVSPDTGDLHVFVIGIDHVARQWEADPYWDGKLLPRGSHVPSWKWITPSKYRPKSKGRSEETDVSFWASRVKQGLGPSPSDYRKPQPDGRPKLVDYFVVEASRKQAAAAAAKQEKIGKKSPRGVIREEYTGGDSSTAESTDSSVGPSDWLSSVGSFLKKRLSNSQTADDFNM